MARRVAGHAGSVSKPGVEVAHLVPGTGAALRPRSPLFAMKKTEDLEVDEALAFLVFSCFFFSFFFFFGGGGQYETKIVYCFLAYVCYISSSF